MNEELQKLIKEMQSSPVLKAIVDIQDNLQKAVPSILTDPAFQRILEQIQQAEKTAQKWVVANAEELTRISKLVNESPALVAAEKFMAQPIRIVPEVYKAPLLPARASTNELWDRAEKLTLENQRLREELEATRAHLESVLEERKQTIGFKRETE